MWGNVAHDPKKGVILAKFLLTYKDSKNDSFETKLIQKIDRMYIKLVTKFQRKLLLSLEIRWENFARDPILG